MQFELNGRRLIHTRRDVTKLIDARHTIFSASCASIVGCCPAIDTIAGGTHWTAITNCWQAAATCLSKNAELCH